ncbi:MAG: cbb3-type cytochrome c oxidase subunit I [Dehalococcoidales bacterium]|nr:cbb3-type cytochrome c oxidase subunit I [Dehalococcoidales bacterium]
MATETKTFESDKTAFRTCSVTGFRVHLPAQRLILANAVAAVVFLLIGLVMAILIALTRWEAVHLLPADLYYRFTSIHGTDMLVLWIVFFEVAGLYFGGAVMLNARLILPRLAWLAYALMVAGAVMVNVVMFTGGADVMFTAYVPLKAHPAFYLGVILFAVGALIAVGLFLANIIVAKRERAFTGSVPLVTYGLIAAAVIAVYTLLSGAITFVPAFFWSIGLIPDYDPALYRVLFWAFGHPAQQINLAAMVAVWYALGALTVGAKPVNEKLSRVAFLLYILFINLGSVHHLMVDPGLSQHNRIFNTSYFIYLAVVASMIHAYSIPAGVEVAQRAKGYVKGIFQWLVRAPWKEPGFAALAVSLVIFGFIGGTSGVIQGTLQLNLIAHNTLRIPGHFHATVVGGTTLAFMGLAYYLVPLMASRQLVGLKWAKVQPYIFGAGITLLSLGMMWSGILGVPRRTWDISPEGAALAAPAYEGAQFTTAILGMGGSIATIGGIIFVLIMVLTLLNGKKMERAR